MLFECLQDITGGEIVFGLGIYALMADITTDKNRTKRMAVLDAFKYLGHAIGFALGGIIQKSFGWIPLYLTSITLIVIDILYIVFFVKESSKLKNTDQSSREDNKAQTSSGELSKYESVEAKGISFQSYFATY